MILKIILFYTVGFCLGVALYFLGLRPGLLFTDDPIVFYRGLKVLAVTGTVHYLVLIGCIVFFLKNRISKAHALSVVMSVAAFCSTFLIVFPVSIDRSVSVFMLGYMAHFPEGLTKQELAGALEGKYIREYDAIGRRIDEQVLSGNVAETDGKRLALTPQGRRFIDLSSWIARVLGIDDRFVNPRVERVE